MYASDPLLRPLPGAATRSIGGVQIDVVKAGDSRVKRIVYPAGFRWSTHMQGIAGTGLCMHAHVGFLAHGQIHIQYQDGCTSEFQAPEVLAIDPGHDGWVVGDEPAIVIEFDFESETVRRLGMPEIHSHGAPDNQAG
jgi:hypothetical protein